MNNPMKEVPKVIRVFGSLFDLFFGEGFAEENWTRVSIKGDIISYVKGKEINLWLKEHGRSLILLAERVKEKKNARLFMG